MQIHIQKSVKIMINSPMKNESGQDEASPLALPLSLFIASHDERVQKDWELSK